MKQELEQAIAAAVQKLFSVQIGVELTQPDEQFGDYATNVALQLAKQVGKPPREVADTLAASEELMHALADKVSEVSVAGPGFVNLKLTDMSLMESLQAQPGKPLAGKTVVVELSSPNPFKDFHIGHVYNNVVGEALANLHETAGATVHRVSYHGDVGMHIAMAIWGVVQKTQGDAAVMLNLPEKERPKFLGEAYAAGATAYKDNEAAAAEIKAINAKVYEASDETINTMYDTGKSWSFAYFDSIYERLGSRIDKQYYESQSGPRGLELVKEHIDDGIFEKSDGAVVYKGEKAGLHTRVFINAQGLPTYEAKDLGLTMLKWDDYHYDRSVIVTANEINEYFKVVLAALAEIDAELAEKTAHLSHGLIKLTTGKMSSRTGKVLAAVEVLEMVEAAVKQTAGEDNPSVDASTIGAIKYAFLKQRVGGDIVFDVQESVALEGNSGPYLQYAHARARSILRKAEKQPGDITDLEQDERSLVRKLSEYAEAVDKATAELMPHHICTYLYELAQKFNSFYEHNRVIGSNREAVRLKLVRHYADTLKHGLELVGIHAPDTM